MVPLPVKAVRPFVAEIVIVPEPDVLALPKASLNVPAATEMTAVGPTPVAVNVAVYDVPDPEKPERVPFVTATSAAVKSVAASVSVNVTVDVRLVEGVTVLGDGVIVTVGPIASRVIVVDAVAAAAGPAFDEVSVAPFAAKRGWIVPSEQLVIVTVRVAPLSVPGAYTQPVAVPAFEKSPAATPVTDSEYVSVYAMLEEFVGDDTADVKLDTVGAVVSVMLAPIDCAAEVTLPRVAV